MRPSVCYHKYLVLALWRMWLPNMLSPNSNVNNLGQASMYACTMLSIVSRSNKTVRVIALLCLLGAGSQCDIGKKLFVYVLSERAVRTLHAPVQGNQYIPWNIHNPTLRATIAGSVHALHYDMGVRTLLAMLQGCKAVTLIPPEQTYYLYPYPMGHVFARRAQVDLDHPDSVKACSSQKVCDALWRYAVLLCWDTSPYCQPD